MTCGCQVYEHCPSCDPEQYGRKAQPMKQLIVALWGPASVGKDTIQQTLGWPKASFAACLKDRIRPVLIDLVGMDIEVREQKEQVRPILEECANTLRKIDPFVAIKKLALPPGPVACVTDLRAWNEMVKVWAMGGVVYEVRREGIEFKDAWQMKEAEAIRKACLDFNVTVPVIQNTTPREAARAIKDDLRARVGTLATLLQ